MSKKKQDVGVQNEIRFVEFHGQNIATLPFDGRPYVSARHISENIGVRWHGQWELINRDETLKSSVRMMRMVASDGTERELACLPLDLIPGWLFKVSERRILNPDARARLLLYKQECFRVLYDYWFRGGAISPDATPDQVERLKRELEETRIECDLWRSTVLYGSISDANGRRRTLRRRGTYVAPKVSADNPKQLTLGF